jgi:hypothetical protein
MRLAAALLVLAAASSAHAAAKPQGPMQTCTAQWLAMRNAGDLHGQNYKSFIRLCLQSKASDWAPVTSKADTGKKAPAKPRALKAKASGGNRMKLCGAKWQGMKAANATNGQTWRQFSSQCLRSP